MDDKTTPNRSANQTKAEGDRWGSNADTAGQGSGSEGFGTGSNAGGITNRPLEEEDENQAAVPDRGESQHGAHAGHGDSDRSER